MDRRQLQSRDAEARSLIMNIATTVDRTRPGSTGPTDQQVQQYLRTGLRNRWWPILPSRFVGTGARPLGITRLGEALVLWRDAKGTIHVQADRCPHRAVPLSRGINEGDR